MNGERMGTNRPERPNLQPTRKKIGALTLPTTTTGMIALAIVMVVGGLAERSMMQKTASAAGTAMQAVDNHGNNPNDNIDLDDAAAADRLDGRVLMLLRQLGDRRASVRRTAAAELRRLPDDLNPALVRRLRTLGPREQLELMDVLAARKAPGTAEAIVDLIVIHEPASDTRLIRALGAFGVEGWECLSHRLFGKPDEMPPANRQPRLEQFYGLFIRQHILGIFLTQLERGGRLGYFAEMYTPVFRYGPIAVDTLAQFVSNENNILNSVKPDDVAPLQIAAARTLGESPFRDRTIRALRGVLQRRLPEQPMPRPVVSSDTNRLERACKYSLYILGDRELAQQILDNDRRQAEAQRNSPQAFNSWSDLGHTYIHVKEYGLAVEAYRQALRIAEQFARVGADWQERVAMANFNLACAFSRLGDAESALGAIRRAVDLGYANWEWMFRDGDLRTLWGFDGFKKWIRELRADERFAAMIPDWEPGNPPDPADDELANRRDD